LLEEPGTSSELMEGARGVAKKTLSWKSGNKTKITHKYRGELRLIRKRREISLRRGKKRYSRIRPSKRGEARRRKSFTTGEFGEKFPEQITRRAK